MSSSWSSSLIVAASDGGCEGHYTCEIVAASEEVELNAGKKRQKRQSVDEEE